MKGYLVLLRGINVGGKNKVPMPQLKELFEQSGFRNVMTYINSGNILFFSDIPDAQQLKEQCERLILQRFQLSIPVMVITASDLLSAFDHRPSWWGQDKASSHNAIFIIPPVTFAEISAAVGEINPEYEKVSNYGTVVFWSVPVKTHSRTRWSKIVGTALYGSITIRNANTFAKLSQLAQQYV